MSLSQLIPQKPTQSRCRRRRTYSCGHQVPDEVEILREFSRGHPNVVQLHDITKIHERHSLFLEWCSGGTLTDRLRAHGPYNEIDTIRIVRVIVDVIRYLHGHGIAHGGLALHSVLFRTEEVDSNVVVAGFSEAGVVRPVNGGRHADVQAETLGSVDFALEALLRDLGDITFIVMSLLSVTGKGQTEMTSEQIAGHYAGMLDDPSQNRLSANALEFIATCLEDGQTAEKVAKHPWLALSTPKLKRTWTALAQGLGPPRAFPLDGSGASTRAEHVNDRRCS